MQIEFVNDSECMLLNGYELIPTSYGNASLSQDGNMIKLTKATSFTQEFVSNLEGWDWQQVDECTMQVQIARGMGSALRNMFYAAFTLMEFGEIKPEQKARSTRNLYYYFTYYKHIFSLRSGAAIDPRYGPQPFYYIGEVGKDRYPNSLMCVSWKDVLPIKLRENKVQVN